MHVIKNAIIGAQEKTSAGDQKRHYMCSKRRPVQVIKNAIIGAQREDQCM